MDACWFMEEKNLVSQRRTEKLIWGGQVLSKCQNVILHIKENPLFSLILRDFGVGYKLHHSLTSVILGCIAFLQPALLQRL